MADLVPALAAALEELRRTPGSGLGWVDEVVHQLERVRQEDYDRVRRLHGFAHRLAALGRLSDEESATLATGLFFTSVIGDPPRGRDGKPPRAWAEYLRREAWVTPPLHVARFVLAPDWEDSPDSLVAVLAKAVWVFDVETVVHGSRPLEVLTALRARAGAPGMARVVELFWSDQGQTLCQRHVVWRRQPYSLKASDVRDSIQVLSASARRARAERAAEAGPVEGYELRPLAPLPESFQQRRRALASRRTLRQAFGAGAHPASDDETSRGSPPAPEAAYPTPARQDTAAELRPPPATGAGWQGSANAKGHGQPGGGAILPFPAQRGEGQAGREMTQPASGELGPSDSPEPLREEEHMDTRSRASTDADAHDDLHLVEKLEELRTRLREMEQLAREGEALLSALAPPLEDFSAMLMEFESTLNRSKGQPPADAEEAA